MVLGRRVSRARPRESSCIKRNHFVLGCRFISFNVLPPVEWDELFANDTDYVEWFRNKGYFVTLDDFDILPQARKVALNAHRLIALRCTTCRLGENTMTLRTCHDCHKEVSSSAQFCPHCGARDMTSFGNAVIFIVIVLLAALGLVLYVGR